MRYFPFHAVLLLGLAAFGCGPRDGAGTATKKPAAPAEVEKPTERDLATIRLTPRAKERLGIETVRSERRKVERVRTLGGDVVIPPGLAVAVSAPVSGTVTLPAGRSLPRPGAAVKGGQPTFELLPVVSPEARVDLAVSQSDAEGAVQKGKVQLAAAKVSFARAEELLREKAGSVRALDEARAQLEAADASLKAALARKEVLAEAIVDLDAGTVAPLVIVSPMDGLLRNLYAAPGQLVPANSVLFEVFSAARVWIRVPVYVGDLKEIDTGKDVLVGELAANSSAPRRAARPVAAPPSADPDAATVDLFYELDNVGGLLRPGQKVGVTLPLRGEQERLVVPWGAVLYDVQGGAWVYEMIHDIDDETDRKPDVDERPFGFILRRVQVQYVAGDTAILESGPKAGAEIVTSGAAELFGTQFGIGK